MPLPKPKKGQSKEDFIASCMSNDNAQSEFPDEKQRLGFCYTQWKEKDSMTDKLEKRSLPITELRVIETGDKRKITGYAAVFDSMSQDLGGFKEKIKRGAFKGALKQSDTRALWNHDSNIVLGRTSSGTLKMQEDKRGLSIEIDPPRWAEPYMESIERGDVNQMSFGFIVGKDQWEEREGETIRTLIDIAELPDVSIVPYPAYMDTSVAIRSLEEWRNKDKEETGEEPETNDGIDVDKLVDKIIERFDERTKAIEEKDVEPEQEEQTLENNEEDRTEENDNNIESSESDDNTLQKLNTWLNTH